MTVRDEGDRMELPTKRVKDCLLYTSPINEDEEQYQTYFLNMVDESDLLALLDDDTAAALTTCNLSLIHI